MSKLGYLIFSFSQNISITICFNSYWHFLSPQTLHIEARVENRTPRSASPWQVGGGYETVRGSIPPPTSKYLRIAEGFSHPATTFELPRSEVISSCISQQCGSSPEAIPSEPVKIASSCRLTNILKPMSILVPYLSI